MLQRCDRRAGNRRFDDSLQRLFMDYPKSQHGSWQDLQASLKGRDFFRAGPLMRALENDQPCVLLIDELDKVASITVTLGRKSGFSSRIEGHFQ